MGGGGPTLVCYPLSLPFSLCTYAAVTEKGVPAAPGLPAFEARLRGHGRRYRLSVHAVSCSGSSGGGGERCVSGFLPVQHSDGVHSHTSGSVYSGGSTLGCWVAMKPPLGQPSSVSSPRVYS